MRDEIRDRVYLSGMLIHGVQRRTTGFVFPEIGNLRENLETIPGQRSTACGAQDAE